MMHGNLTPQNIVVNSSGSWKIMGFNFCCYSQYQSDAQVRQWTPSNPATLGTNQNGLIRGVSSFQGWNLY